MRGIFLGLVLLGGILGVTEREGTARFDFRYIDRPCVGNNGLEPGAVKTALEDAGIPDVEIIVPAKPVALCEECYPKCDFSETYTAVVPLEHKKKARKVIKKLETDVPEAQAEDD